MSNLELAEKVSLSPSACLKRTKTLEQAGCIRDYVMAVDLDKVCTNVQAYLEISMLNHTPSTLNHFQKQMLGNMAILDCMRVSGGIDYIAFAVTTTVPEMNALATELMEEKNNVKLINTRMILDKPKWFGGYPLELLEWKDEI